MSQVALLVILLFVAYVGGVLRSEHSRVGMASGIEYVLGGLLLGPYVLGFFTHASIQGFEPLLLMTLGWLATTLGMEFGVQDGKRLPTSLFAYGWALALISCTVVGLAAAYLAERVAHLTPTNAQLVGLACGAVGAGSGRHAVKWTMSESDAPGGLGRLLSGLGNVDDLPPLFALTGLVIVSPPSTTANWSGVQLAAASLALGAVLGITVAALIGSRLRKSELWPVLLGAVLLVVGIVLRLQLPFLAPVFLLGLFVVLLSPHRERIRALVSETERPLLLPTLLLTGAVVQLPFHFGEWVIVGGVLLLRLLVQGLGGLLLPLVFPTARGRGWLLGQALMPASNASIVMGLVIYLIRPGEVGRLALFIAVAATLLGEVLGASALRRLAQLDKPPIPGRDVAVEAG